jgi:hypothetical protein
LGIYLDPNSPNEMIESYTFNITYPSDSKTQVQLETTHEQPTLVHTFQPHDTKKQIMQLMRTLLVMMQTLSPLPDTKYLTMKLHYYDDITPANYEPPLFRPASTPQESTFHFALDPQKIKLGKVQMAEHG